MLKNKALDVIKTFNPAEIKSFELFIVSPYFNSNKAIIKLFELIRKRIQKASGKPLLEEELFLRLFPGKKYNYGIMKNLLSDLFGLCEIFLAIKPSSNINLDNFEHGLKRLDEYNSRFLDKMFFSEYSRLEKLIEYKDNIIEILAHDLRNPLGTIGALSNMVTIEKDEDEKKKILHMITRTSENALALVKDVLEMAALEQVGSTIKLQPLQTSPIIYDVVKSQTAAASSKGIHIEVKNSEATQLVLADPTYFRQVIENLITNAIKFSDTGKKIEVSILSHDHHIQIRVRDQGPGVPVAEENRLFKKFSRLSAQPTAGESTSGLGLSLVKRYMELMKGRVWHERPADEGAIFAVEFMIA